MDGRFPTTRWSLILRAGDSQDPDSRDALADLCQAYWEPVYIFVRRRGHDVDKARDLTQTFFVRLLEQDFFGGLSPEGGRFRSYLLVAVKNHLTDVARQATRLKRGSGRSPLSLDIDAAEDGLRLEAVGHGTPETEFETRWARTVLQRAFDGLRQECRQLGKESQFDRLRPYLTGEQPVRSYREVATELDMTEDAVKMAVHRLRKRLGESLRSEIAETVAESEEVDGEVRHILAVLRA